jgi:uncharacterized protein YggE
MLMVWRPWTGLSSDQTISVTGEAKLSDRPDEYVFYPSYQFKDADKSVSLDQLSKKSAEVVAKLKELGVADNKIKTNSSGYDFPVYRGDGQTATYTLSLTITVDSGDLAQKVQDYLITTSPEGAISPQAQFSDAKRRELESRARDEATKDARQKADQMAKNLGFKIGRIKTVTDSSGFGVIPLRGVAEDSATSAPQLTIQPGENDLHYSVTVEYFIR